jgi:hypothetical protein
MKCLYFKYFHRILPIACLANIWKALYCKLYISPSLILWTTFLDGIYYDSHFKLRKLSLRVLQRFQVLELDFKCRYVQWATVLYIAHIHNFTWSWFFPVFSENTEEGSSCSTWWMCKIREDKIWFKRSSH